jgi:adenylate cyclase
MRGPGSRHRLILAAGAGLFALVWTGLLAQSHLAGHATVLDRIENAALDLRILANGARPAPPGVVILAIDEETVRQAGHFPLPRAILAELVHRLAGLSAAAIAFDILFIDPGPPDGDRALADALRETGAVIAAAGLFRRSEGQSGAIATTAQEADQIAWPVNPLADAAAIGVVNVTIDDSGTPRHVPLLLRHNGGVVPSFPLRVAARARNAEVGVDGERVAIGGVVTRTDLGLNLPLHFYGPRGTVPTISANSVLNGSVDRNAIAGRAVIVGTTALGTSDTFSTPFDPIFPGVEVLATATSHLIAGDGLVRDRRVRQLDVVAALTLALGAVLLISFAPLGPALATTALGAMSWLTVTTLSFGQGYWFSVAVPLAALAGPAILCAVGRQALERRHSRYLARAERALRGFQPPTLADRIVQDPTFLAHPERRSIPILFVDLSNFTRLSEHLGPAETREILREFHAVVEDEIARKGGLVLNFMGDGAMIAFGLPDAKADDAHQAVEAAIGLANAVREWLAARSLASLDVRVGAHYGPVVLSRLGTKTHQQITAAGDSVNVASRLLEVAALEQAPVVATAELLSAAGNGGSALLFDTLKVVEIRGRGQRQALAVWRPPGRTPTRSGNVM